MKYKKYPDILLLTTRLYKGYYSIFLLDPVKAERSPEGFDFLSGSVFEAANPLKQRRLAA